jgi:hypothetical protein
LVTVEGRCLPETLKGELTVPVPLQWSQAICMRNFGSVAMCAT